MFYSEFSLEQLMEMSWEEKWNVAMENVRDDGQSGEVALLLGTWPEQTLGRAHAAAELYHAGRVKYIVPSGGVEWEYNSETLTEAELMTRILLQDGVPESAIIPDNEARTTKENMICGTLVIERNLTFKNVEHVIIVTSQNHMQRSLALAKAFLPRKVSVSAYPDFPHQTKEEWLASEDNRHSLDRSIRMTKSLVDTRIVEDIEF